jgi:hypothetical protein
MDESPKSARNQRLARLGVPETAPLRRAYVPAREPHHAHMLNLDAGTVDARGGRPRRVPIETPHAAWDVLAMSAG